MSPAQGTRPSKALSNTVFPEPFGPMMARHSPAGTSRLRPWRMARLPNLTSRFVTDSIEPPTGTGFARRTNSVEIKFYIGFRGYDKLRLYRPLQAYRLCN